MKLFLFSLLLIFSACTSRPILRQDKLSILQGLTSTKEVEFSVVASKAMNLRFELRSQEGEVLAPKDIKKVERTFSNFVVYKFIFERDQEKDFNLYAFDGEKLVDQRLIGRGQSNQDNLRLALLSCMDDGQIKHFKIWDELQKRKPEYILMIGDNVYADRESTGGAINSTPETIWNRYVETRLALPFFFQQYLVPVHTLWDDHDYGKNDGDSTFEHKVAAQEVFETFSAQQMGEETWEKGHGVGGLLSLGDFNLYFLDGRSFREPGTEGKELGTEQTNWLLKSLKDESQPSFVIKGDQFFGGYHAFESYEGRHPEDFNKFVTALRSIGTPITFLSGDRHLSEIMQFPRSLFGLPTFEITSSPMHAKTFSGSSSTKNPWRVVVDDANMNFTMIDNVAKDNHWFLDVESVDENGKVLYRRELAVYIKDLQNNLNEVRKRRHGKRRYRSKWRRR